MAVKLQLRYLDPHGQESETSQGQKGNDGRDKLTGEYKSKVIITDPPL